MKRLVTLAACLAMLTFSGCASGICGGLFGGSNSGCNSQPSLFSGGGLLSDGPLRQFMRGDACDSCNSAAGQIMPGMATGSAPTCNACGSVVPNDPYAVPMGAPLAQPTTSYYPSDSGVSLGQPMIHDDVSPIDPGAIIGSQGVLGGFDSGLSEPPRGIN